MGKLIFVTGGAKSGKSTFAEKLAGEFGIDVLYVATSIPFDDEMKLRIKRHREQRPEAWETVETYKDMDVSLKGKTKGRSAVLLDCITIMVSNILFELRDQWDGLSVAELCEAEAAVRKEICTLLEVVRDSDTTFIVVSNEVGMGIVPENALARIFRDIAGSTNQLLAKAADEVYWCVAGIPVRIKG